MCNIFISKCPCSFWIYFLDRTRRSRNISRGLQRLQVCTCTRRATPFPQHSLVFVITTGVRVALKLLHQIGICLIFGICNALQCKLGFYELYGNMANLCMICEITIIILAGCVFSFYSNVFAMITFCFLMAIFVKGKIRAPFRSEEYTMRMSRTKFYL